MPAEAAGTTYPVTRDPLPHIDANTQEDGVGVEHDVLHAKANALLNRLQDLLGLASEMPATSVLQRLADLEAGGVPSGGGSTAVEILVADGYSAPPVMLTNEAEDDFVYAD